MLVRLIAPEWLKAHVSKRVLEADLSTEQIAEYNELGYNVYYTPNFASQPPTEGFVDGTFIDTFQYVFIDFDLKDNAYPSKEAFIEKLFEIEPTKVVDSGGGVHGYYRVSDLDAKSYLRLSRRLIRYFNTDEAVGQIFQLMRLENTQNTKIQGNPRLCEALYTTGPSYTCEELDKLLPPITQADEQYCNTHYDKTYKIDRNNISISDVMPAKFGELLMKNHEAQDLWAGNTSDRSKSDYRLGHIMFANGFTRDEAATVLSNSSKALNRAPVHRVSYAQNIIDKIWTFELEPSSALNLSSSVEEYLSKAGDTLKGTPFRCHKRIDNTEHGFRLGQVLGLVAGSGVGKTAFALNLFKWFTEQNPDYHHFFIPLEQPANEIAQRWSTMCGANTSLNKKVHIMSNYDDEGQFRHLSFDDIKKYIKTWQETTKKKIGCIVIDHIGALKKKGKDGENQDLMDICHAMKAFAIETKTLLVMQSQTSRPKAGWGDLELDKDAAYGTMYFEAYCDYLVTLWQPLKRCHQEEGCPLVTAFKFCKIRHKNAKKDKIKEDVPYYFAFNSDTELMEDMTQDQKTSFNYFLPLATKKRNADKKTALVEYTSVPYEETPSVKTSSVRDYIRH